jgi:hypothetical protein
MNRKVIAMVGKTPHNYSACVIIGDGIAVATGYTLAELKQQMNEAVEFHIEGMMEDGDEIPSPFDGEFQLVFKFYKSMLKPARRAKKIGLRRPS